MGDKNRNKQEVRERAELEAQRKKRECELRERKGFFIFKTCLLKKIHIY